MKPAMFKHELVASIPEELQAGILYVAKDGDVAGHLCACGCGREVITPLSPTDWSLTVDQRGVTLEPSIGNWAFPCRSHYFMWDGNVVWAKDMPAEEIAQGRLRDKIGKQRYYRNINALPPATHRPVPELRPATRQTYLQRLAAWWKRLFPR